MSAIRLKASKGEPARLRTVPAEREIITGTS